MEEGWSQQAELCQLEHAGLRASELCQGEEKPHPLTWEMGSEGPPLFELVDSEHLKQTRR